MLKFKFNQRQTSNLTVIMILAALVAVTMLAQPLGLAFSDNSPKTDLNEDQSLALVDETDFTLEPFDSVDSLEVPLSRSSNEVDKQALSMDPSGDIDGNYEYDADGNLIESPEVEPDVDLLNEPLAAEPADPIVEEAAHILYVTKNGVNMRAEPNTESAIVTVLSIGKKLTATGETDRWEKVKDGEGHEGFISTAFASQAMVFIEKNDTVYVMKSSVNLRKEPSTSSASLSLLNADTKLTRTGIGDNWTRVKTSTGKTGYIATSFLTSTVPASLRPRITPPKATTAVTTVINKSGNRIVDLAYSMLGIPYVWGSESRSGVDCSGLIYYIYKQIGVTVPRTSSGYYNFGSAVTLSTMQPGDIIAMDTRRDDGRTSITHLGIYVGGGDMIHASSTNRKVVKSNISQYLSYGIKLITIRRINA